MEREKFRNGMKVSEGSYIRILNRWTKNGADRVYINGTSRKGDGYVDLTTKEFKYGGCFQAPDELTAMAKRILEMDFSKEEK